MLRQMTNLHALAGMLLAAVLWIAPPAYADVWNERTELTFTESVMIPGATLEPGTYIFELSESAGMRHLIKVYKKDDRELVALTQAVPVRRVERTGDTILRFNPTDQGVPALKGWFYPGQTTGHEFVYSEEQAKQIAERSKTVVLSVDVPDTDLSKGSLHVYDAAGTRVEWRADPDTTREWDAWQKDRAATMKESREPATEPADTGEEDAPKATAPMMAGTGAAMSVDLDDLEENPSEYLDKRISVDAEIEKVFGPRLFTIDEPNWADLDGEILVYAPSLLAALVKADDRVTITGTVQSMAVAEFEREWGWFGLDKDVEVEFMKKPVLVAERIIGGNNNVAMSLDMTPAGTDPAAGAAAGTASTTVMDLGLIGQGTSDLVGRKVDLKNVRVLQPAQGGGFFVETPNAAVLVVPAHNVSVTVAPGDQVTIQGAIADAPRNIGERVSAPAGWNHRIYILATAVSK